MDEVKQYGTFFSGSFSGGSFRVEEDGRWGKGLHVGWDDRQRQRLFPCPGIFYTYLDI